LAPNLTARGRVSVIVILFLVAVTRLYLPEKTWRLIWHQTETDAPLIDRVEAILTSVGVARTLDRGVFRNERISARDVTAHQVEELIAGDLGGGHHPEGWFECRAI
jgi:hypothetical protein